MKYEDTALPHVFLCLLCHGHGVFFLDHAYLGHDHDHALYVENDLGHDFWKGTSGQVKSMSSQWTVSLYPQNDSLNSGLYARDEIPQDSLFLAKHRYLYFF